jgi:hypothetical protein
LQELEKIELEKRKGHNKREKRRLKRVNDNSDAGSEDLDEEELSDDDNISYQNEIDQVAGANGAQGAGRMKRLSAIQQLIQSKKKKGDTQMRSKMSHQFINQMLIFSLINKTYIKDTLQKEYQKTLD